MARMAEKELEASKDAGSIERLTSCYAANLARLYRSDPELALRVDELPFAQLPPLERTRDGNLTVKLVADDERGLYAHSRYHPREEARRLVDAQPPLELPAFLVTGIGLGYHLEALEERYDHPLLIVAEDDLRLIKAALCVVDLTAALGDGRLTFLTMANKAHLHERLTRINTDLMLGLHYLVPPFGTRCHVQFHGQIRELITDYIAFGKVQIVTVLRNARVTTKNIAFNLAAYLSNPGVEVLKDRARGFPAIVVAAGPSLARNIDQLPHWSDRAVVIAVQTVFRNLLARGMPPHFVTSLDYNEISAQFFRGISEVGRSILVAEPKATWYVPDLFPGRMHLLRHRLHEDLLRRDAPPHDAIKGGSTVAHLCFYLAEYLGCDPVIFLGQDLSFTEGLYYSPGMPVERMWQPELGLFNTLEMKQWERVMRNRGILRPAEDIHGRPAYTDDQMFTYAEQFESDFARCDRRIIHACEGGMRIEGMEIMTLAEAGAQFCTRAVPRDLFDIGPGRETPAGLKDRAIAQLETRLDEVRAMREIARATVTVLQRLEGLVEQPGEFNRLVARVDDSRTRIRKYDQTYKVVVGVSQLAELRRYSADRRLGEVKQETAETALRRLKRDREFVSAFIEGCEYLESILPESIERVRERMS